LIKNGKTLLSGIDPVRRAERTADSVSLNDRTLFFCPSPLYGFGLERLLSRLKNAGTGCAVLCVEADPELYELSMANIDASLCEDKMLHITNVCDKALLCDLVRAKWGARAFRRVELVRFSGGYQLCEQVYDSLLDALRRDIATDWSNALTLTKLGRLYIRNAVRNLSLLSKYPSVSELSFGEENVLVLGAGPSLDETLDFLVRSEELGVRSRGRKFRIICVDTCLGALKDRGIVPDLVVILESQHWNIRDFIGSAGSKMRAAVDISSLPASAKILGGSGYLFMTLWTNLNIFERLKKEELLPILMPPLGSVGLTAVELARRLTRGKIICAGLDFSFTADKYHARSTPGHRGRLNLQTRFLRLFNTASFHDTSIAVMSKSGQNVYTNPVMKNYRDLFEQEFSGDPRIFDIESTGLPLGVKTISHNELIEILMQRTHTKAQKHRESEASSSVPPCLCVNSSIVSFYENELKRLKELRSILTGDAAMDEERLGVLVNECDYLWAHFPDCAGGRAPDLKEASFLKRMRAEIDPMIKLISHII